MLFSCFGCASGVSFVGCCGCGLYTVVRREFAVWGVVGWWVSLRVLGVYHGFSGLGGGWCFRALEAISVTSVLIGLCDVGFGFDVADFCLLGLLWFAD